MTAFGSTRLRRLFALPAAIAIAAMPAVALADAPTRFTEHRLDVFCESLTAEGASAFLFAQSSTEFGTFADLAIWLEPATPATDPPTLIGAEASLTAAPDDSSLTGTIPLFTFEPSENPEEPPIGEPAGTATLAATFTAAGPAETFEFVDRFGNQHVRVEETLQPLNVAGTLAIENDVSLTFDLSSCFGSAVDATVFQTNPNAFVFHDSGTSLRCDWETEDLFVQLFAQSGAFGSFSDIFVATADGTFFGFSEDTTLTTSAFGASFLLFAESPGGEEPAGTATASASLSPVGERETFVLKREGERQKVTLQALAVDGALALTVGETATTLLMTDETCQAEDFRVVAQIQDTARGSSRPPANDGPDDALPIGPGGSVNVHTGGAAFEGEVPASCLTLTNPENAEETITFNFAHTVWYTFVGTGGPVTIDTAGSNFDTVLAVYTSDAGGFTEVACVDDQPVGELGITLQSWVTLDTIAGQTYYIQAGGFDTESGHLKIKLR